MKNRHYEGTTTCFPVGRQLRKMGLATSADVAEREGLSERRARTLCATGRVLDSFQLGGTWFCPINYTIDPPLDKTRRRTTKRDKALEWIALDILEPEINGTFTADEADLAACLVAEIVNAGDWP